MDTIDHFTNFQRYTKKPDVSMLPFCAKRRIHYDGVKEVSYCFNVTYYPVDFQLHSLTVGECGMQ